MPLHALELLPDEAGDAAVRADWARLQESGLPSQADHRGATNAPHLTLLAAPRLEVAIEQRAVDLLGPLLPCEAGETGVVLLGGARVTVARLLDVPDELVRAVLALRAHLPDVEHRGWLPHVTLARRVPRADVGRVLEEVGHAERVLRLTTLRRWDPDTRQVRSLLR